MGQRPSLVAVGCAAVLATACRYDFTNPAERLRAGEVRGRVLADAGAGVNPNAGVAVTLKNSNLTQLSRDTGLFVVVPLPPGRHTLLFRKGTTWAIEREVEVPLGRDGQPEGVALGDVVLRYSAEVRGTVDPPAGFPGGPFEGIVVDETTGVTSAFSGRGFSFPVLSTGRHRLAVAVRDATNGQWVGGPVEVDLTEDAQQQAVQLSPVALRPASGQGRLTFQVQAVGAALDPTQVTVAGVPGVVTPAADGTVDVLVAEGHYRIGLTAPAAAGVLSAEGHGPVASLARPALEPPAGTIDVVVLDDERADVGPIYLVEAGAVSEALLGCVADADCACYHPACELDGTCGGGGLCEGWSPPPAVPATTPFCNFDSERDFCSTPGSCPASAYCALPPGGGSGSCLPCGTACTFDGLVATRPGTGECGSVGVTVTGVVNAVYWAEDGTTETGPAATASQTTVSAVPAGSTTSLPGTFDPATGAFSIPGVPLGAYLLVVDGRPAGGAYQAFESTTFTRNVTAFVAGRRTRALAASSTPVTFDTTTVFDTLSADRFTFVSAGAGLNLDRADTGFLGTTGPMLVDFVGLGLPDAAAGDLVYAAHLVSTLIFSGAPGGTTVLNAQGAANLAFTLADGSPSVVGVSFGTPSTTGQLNHTFDEAAWQALGADLTLGGGLSLELRVLAIPHTLTFPAPAGVEPTMWLARIPAGSGAFTVTTDYGRFLGPNFNEVLGVRYLFTAGFNAAGASPAIVELPSGSVYPLAAAPASPGPVLGLPRALTVNGTGGATPISGVSTTPRLGWSAPATGAPTRYEVELVRLVNSNGFTTLEKLASFRLGPTAASLQVPAGLLTAGGEYVAFVTAVQSSNGVAGETVFLAGDYPSHHATNVTAVFTP